MVAFLRASLVLLPLFLTGCAQFWDDVTSHPFDANVLFHEPDPVQVLRTSSDGDARARALRHLQEPKQHGGTDQAQEEVIQIVCKIATTDRQPYCRLCAIRALGRFKDPRAGEALVAAYHQADGGRSNEIQQAGYPGSLSGFQAETATHIRCEALVALGESGNPAALELLIQVLGQPPVEGAEQEQQFVMDQKIAAARALAHFSDPRVAEALLKVLKTEKDVALRNRACESLKTLTGKDLPADFQAWDDALHHQGNGAAPPPARKGKLFQLF
jgi:HEAT repeats/PBS lyase HEAT-like repeat